MLSPCVQSLESRIAALEQSLRAQDQHILDLKARMTASLPALGRAMHAAAKAGNVGNLLDLLRSSMAPELVDYEDEEAKTPLIAAIVAGKLMAVKALLSCGARAQPPAGFHHTGLRAAALMGNAAAAELLLQHGADPNSQSSGARTPLQGACFARPGVSDEDSLRVLQLLVHRGADVDAKNGFGETALFLAASTGKAQHAFCLLAAGACGRLALELTRKPCVTQQRITLILSVAHRRRSTATQRRGHQLHRSGNRRSHSRAQAAEFKMPF